MVHFVLFLKHFGDTLIFHLMRIVRNTLMARTIKRVKSGKFLSVLKTSTRNFF